MKKLTLAFLVLLSPFLLKADNWLQNGDFSSGLDHWHGNGETPASFASDNPTDKPDPSTSNGLFFPLRPSEWRKAFQDFRGKSAGTVTVTYMMLPDTTFSEKSDDYQNVPHHIDYDGWKSFNVPTGSWILFVSDLGARNGTYYMVKPQGTPGTPQTFHASVTGLSSSEDKTITLAFPPGKGTVVILNVSIDDK